MRLRYKILVGIYCVMTFMAGLLFGPQVVAQTLHVKNAPTCLPSFGQLA